MKRTSSSAIRSYPSFVRSISKHNVLIIGGDRNAQIGKNENNEFFLHSSSKRNRKHLTDFPLGNGIRWLNIKFQKRKRKWWTYAYTNNAKAQMNYILIRNGLIALWIVWHFPLLKMCLPITELSQQRLVWTHATIKRKQQKPHTMTGSCLTIEILEINIR